MYSRRVHLSRDDHAKRRTRVGGDMDGHDIVQTALACERIDRCASASAGGNEHQRESLAGPRKDTRGRELVPTEDLGAKHTRNGLGTEVDLQSESPLNTSLREHRERVRNEPRVREERLRRELGIKAKALETKLATAGSEHRGDEPVAHRKAMR